jgi:hypothetical protein
MALAAVLREERHDVVGEIDGRGRQGAEGKQATQEKRGRAGRGRPPDEGNAMHHVDCPTLWNRSASPSRQTRHDADP